MKNIHPLLSISLCLCFCYEFIYVLCIHTCMYSYGYLFMFASQRLFFSYEFLFYKELKNVGFGWNEEFEFFFPFFLGCVYWVYLFIYFLIS